ncbi:hypothetical protein CAXC1_150057 [Candidatus Xenohaliotis californiensis]|uniref:Uncharacterized protein n=1 Tax=Candidatus Xenohaliotis californiensis TaxID=84677 RepID=A0ABM9N846_9RICK|nr:hypothetical protein CAXC1_150057 [Candidatus Xenohaliotis californiensis]
MYLLKFFQVLGGLIYLSFDESIIGFENSYNNMVFDWLMRVISISILVILLYF